MEAPTSEERRVVAERLSTAARWSYVWIDDKTLRELTGMEPSGLNDDSTIIERMDSVREIFRHLADLIDPTCQVSSVETYCNELGQLDGWEFHLTCGHSVQRPYYEAPPYCTECGARVV